MFLFINEEFHSTISYIAAICMQMPSVAYISYSHKQAPLLHH